jgi:hypothetical protein
MIEVLNVGDNIKKLSVSIRFSSARRFSITSRRRSRRWSGGVGAGSAGARIDRGTDSGRRRAIHLEIASEAKAPRRPR